MKQISTAEKIETIVDFYLKYQKEVGTFGAIYRNPNGSFTVTIDNGGGNFLVKTNEIGWAVRPVNSTLEGVDADLYEAARLATTA